ncbi:hypothetical protein PYW07_006121 [Mythimna separata]|uniref:Partial AB-hydrolase lipase domain-containing protein n=1 Tax=Mythimna separata TaxID=271217 RepID=A0AAD7YK54_MYTSE|nr:hypothetical protein PYW07_006121 [Mythimna separata]
MKAACVLVCLALAHGITASIFKHQERGLDGLDVQQFKYIDQYEKLLREQPTEDQKLREQTHQTQKNSGKQIKDQKIRNPVVQDETYQDLLTQVPITQYQQRVPSYEEQYQQRALLNSQEWPTIRKHSHHHDRNHHHSSSSESSQESRERRYYGNQETIIHGDYQKWISPLVKSVMNKDYMNTPVISDIIEWNGLRMAVEPNSPVQTPEDIEEIFGDAHKAMRHIEEVEKAKFHEVYEVATQEVNDDVILNSTQLAQKYLYPIEEHTIKTDDGYILTLFRIPPQKQTRDVLKKPVVFLMHGMLGSSDDWLIMGPKKSLAYLLADAGYDVWLGNARGNKYSRRHVTRWPAMADFWQFSIDEIALHDLPAMIDFALETTKQEKLYYIGHALGTTAFFALTATRPEYNNKVVMMYALSPMVYMTNVRSPLFRMLSPISKFQERISRQIGNEAFTPSKELIHTVGGAMCENEIGCKKVCSNMQVVMAGINVDGMDSSVLPVVMAHLPAGSSAKVIKQYGQGVASHEFRRYDYGPYINTQVYGTLEAPRYNISAIRAPVTLYYSEEDWLAHPKDVVRLQRELPNVRETYMVPEEHFSHLDFQFSSRAPEMVYQRIIDSMQNEQQHIVTV